MASSRQYMYIPYSFSIFPALPLLHSTIHYHNHHHHNTQVTEKLLAAGVDYVWPKPPPLPSVIKPKIDSLLAMRIKTYGNVVQDM